MSRRRRSRGATFDELAGRLPVRRSLLENVLHEEVELGRVRHDPDDDRYRIVVGKFDREVLHSLRRLEPEHDVDASRPARRIDGRPRVPIRRSGLGRNEEAALAFSGEQPR
jgi:hypothetical protein